MIDRYLYHQITQNLSKQKVSLLLGARRVGKTELLKKIKASYPCLWLNGEDADVQQLLDNRSIANYTRLLQYHSLLIIDEAQFIPGIGRKVKLMIDEIKPLHVILTGSSAFELSQASEPLVGRSITYQLFPLAQLELQASENSLQTIQALEDRLIYGSYPEVITSLTAVEKKAYLNELVNTFLLKDILAFENIRNPQKLKDLLKLIAYQVGKEVSLEELGRQLGMSKNTVERYLDLLSKVFVLYKRSGFSRNLRKEITKSSRWYFFDNGLRHAILNDFSPLALRQDIGAIWEGYFLSERQKRNSYKGDLANSYFWRTYDGQEIDLIEESNGSLNAFECKWKTSKTKVPEAFRTAYPDAAFHVAHATDYLEWIN